MFFDLVTLKRNSWHQRLLKWTFGSPVMFTNFCPYFWLTIFTLLIFPFTCIFRGGEFLIKKAIPAFIDMLMKVAEGLANIIDFTIYSPIEKITFRILSDSGLYKLYMNSLDSFKDEEKLKRWKEMEGEGAEERLARIKALKEERLERSRILAMKRHEERQRLAKIRQQRLTKIAMGTKAVAPYLLGLLSLVVAYLVYLSLLSFIKFITFLSGAFNWHLIFSTFLLYSSYVLAALGITAFIALIFLTGAKLGERYCPTRPYKAPPETPKLLVAIGRFFKVIGATIAAFFTGLAYYIKAMKQDNCPGIEWED